MPGKKDQIKYPPVAHIINVLFLGLIVAAPLLFCLKNLSLSGEDVNTILFATFILGVVVLADWYHMHITNSYPSILFVLVTGLVVSVACVAAALFFSQKGALDLVFFAGNSWDEYDTLFKLYATGLGIFCSALLSLPRLFLIRLFTQAELPQME